jgi:hypothetical protein
MAAGLADHIWTCEALALFTMEEWCRSTPRDVDGVHVSLAVPCVAEGDPATVHLIPGDGTQPPRPFDLNA